MLGFIKVFFQGILYVLLSPFLLLALALNLIYSIFVYFAYEIKSVFLFFRGISYKSMDEETRTLKEIKNSMTNPTPSVVQTPIVQQPIVEENKNDEVNENV